VFLPSELFVKKDHAPIVRVKQQLALRCTRGRTEAMLQEMARPALVREWPAFVAAGVVALLPASVVHRLAKERRE